MEHIRDVTRALLDKRPRLRPARAYGAIWAWSDVVGKELARRSEVERVEGACLYVRVVSAPWAQELFLMKPAILRGLREKLGDTTIRDIRFRVATLQGRRRRARPAEARRTFPHLTADGPGPRTDIPSGELGDALMRAYRIARERGHASSSSTSGRPSPSGPGTSS